MREKIALGLVIAVGFTVLAGCSSRAKDGTETTEVSLEAAEELEGGTIDLTIWAEPANFEMLDTMLENFKKEHAGEAEFNFTVEEKADASVRENVLGDVNNAADVFSMVDDQLTDLVAGGALEPVPNPEEIKAANLEEAVEASTVQDILFAYPMTADNGYFLYYNKKYFSETDIQTLDGILAVASANNKKFTMEWSSGWYLYAFFGCTGLELGVNEDGITNYCNWNTTEGEIKGTDIAAAIYAIGANPGFESRMDGDFLTGVQDGSVIAGVSGVWNSMEIKEAWGDDYGAAKLPTYTCGGRQVQMSSFTGYKMMGVNYYSKHKAWALKLAEYLTNEENQRMRFELRSQGPSNKEVASSDLLKEVPAIQALLAQAEYGKLQRVGNNFWSPCTEFGNMMATGDLNGMELQEVMDTLVAGITASTVQ